MVSQLATAVSFVPKKGNLTAFHGIGTSVNHPMSARQAIRLAGLDWEVELRDLRTTDGLDVPHHKALVRKDTSEIFTVVTRRYSLMQNQAAFGFFDEIVGSRAAIYHTVGSLLGGRIVWLLAKLPGYIEVTQDDLLEKFVLLSNSHDTTRSIRGGFIIQRLANQVSLVATAPDTQKDFTLRHRGNLQAKMEKARNAIGIATRYYDVIEDAFQQFLKKRMTDGEAQAYVELVLPLPKRPRSLLQHETWEKQCQRITEVREQIYSRSNFPSGSHVKGVHGTLWGLYNAVGDWAENEYRGSAERKLYSNWFGDRAKIKEEAYRMAVRLVA